MQDPRKNDAHTVSWRANKVADKLAQEDEKNLTQKSFNHRDAVVSATDNTGLIPAMPANDAADETDELDDPIGNPEH